MDDEAGIAGWTETGLTTRVRQFRRVWDAEPRPPGRWLDIGCGAGTYTRLLHAEGHEVVGMDYAVTSLHKAKARSKAEGGGVHWASADILQLPLRDGIADGVLCFGVMQALSRPQNALQEMYRVLRPGGELWVDALNAGCGPTLVSEWRRRQRGLPPHLRYDAPHRFAAAARDTGFEVVHREWLTILPGRWLRFQRGVENPLVRYMLHVLGPVGSFVSHSVMLRLRKPA